VVPSKGVQYYGTFPSWATTTTTERVETGSLVAGTSVDQCAATLATLVWREGNAGMQLVLPNIGRFSTSNLRILS
jgi:hypothetical protein